MKNIKTGGDFINVIKNPFATVKQLVFGIDRFNFASKDTIEKNGQYVIVQIRIARTPLNEVLETAVDALSLGRLSQLQKEKGYDKLYHLSLIIDLSNRQSVIYEKNETVEIIPLSNTTSIKTNTEIFYVPLKRKDLTLDEFISNAQKQMGLDNYWSYRSLQNNCQNFIKESLLGSSLLTKQANEFLYQDMTDIRKSLNKSHAYFEPLLNKITDLGAKSTLLMGKGITKDLAKDEFTNHLLHNTKIIHKFIKNGEFKYI